MKLIVVVEKTEDEYLASCDELRATASGSTEGEAVENLKVAVSELLKHFGHDVIEGMARRKVLAVEV